VLTKISMYQLFAIMVIFPSGSAVLFFITPDEKQDAWLAMLMYIPIGIMLQLIYIQLYRRYPTDTLVTYLPKIFGIYLGTLLSTIYILYWGYQAGRIIRDFSELILIVAMPNTSLFIIAMTFTVIFCYGAFSGLENMARAAQIVLPILLCGTIIIFGLLYATPDIVDFKNLKPYLEKGLISVIKNGWILVTFPYGETLIASMMYSSVNNPSKIKRISFLAIIALGTILAINTIMFLVTLGVTSATGNLFPLFAAMRLIKVGFLDKLDILVLITMMIGGFFKVGLYTYSSMLGTAQLMKVKNPHYLAIPFGVAIFIWSLLITKNYPEHNMAAITWLPLYVHIPLQSLIPITALLVDSIKNRTKNIACTKS